MWDCAVALVWVIILFKVKSHTTIDDMTQGKIDFTSRQGNAYADAFADKGAAINEPPSTMNGILGAVDGTAWLIQSRIMAVCQLYLEKHRPSNDALSKDRKSSIHTLELLGHIPCVDPSRNNWWYCSLCGAKWAHTKRVWMEGQGRCQGPDVWGPPPTMSDKPWRPRRGSRLYHNGH